MATFLFEKIIFGPVISRRLGVSLGINLLPTGSKVCSFDCIYCECGRNPRKRAPQSKLPGREEVAARLEETLLKMGAEERLPDVITFAGNGEPTLHPHFAEIIGDTVALRDRYAPQARIAVLSNATRLHNEEVFRALLTIDDNIQKLDSAFEETIRKLDCPVGRFSLEDTVHQLEAFEGKVIIQTMFIRGSFQGEHIDNTTPEEVEAWLVLLRRIRPSLVMIYTIARDTPVETLEKVSLYKLRSIARQAEAAGMKVQVSG